MTAMNITMAENGEETTIIEFDDEVENPAEDLLSNLYKLCNSVEWNMELHNVPDQVMKIVKDLGFKEQKMKNNKQKFTHVFKPHAGASARETTL